MCSNAFVTAFSRMKRKLVLIKNKLKDVLYFTMLKDNEESSFEKKVGEVSEFGQLVDV